MTKIDVNFWIEVSKLIAYDLPPCWMKHNFQYLPIKAACVWTWTINLPEKWFEQNNWFVIATACFDCVYILGQESFSN